MEAGTEDFGGELVAETERYLERISECVSLLPELLEQYASGAAYGGTVDRIQELERDCDRASRHICRLITNADPGEMGLQHARVHFNAPSLVALFQRIDGIANVVERIAEELAATTPPRNDDCLQGLQEMADHAVTGVDVLGRAVAAFVRVLCIPSQSATVADDIAAIRDTESRVDDLRNRVTATAFDDETVVQQLVYRELAVHCDRLLDIMEDVTDRMGIVASGVPGLVVDPGQP